MKRRLVVPLAVLIVAAVGVGTMAAGASPNGTYGGYPVVRLTVNGKIIDSPVPGIALNGSTLVPFRALAEALGGKVAWDQDSWTAIVEAPDPTRLQSDLDAARQSLATAQTQVDSLKAQLQQAQADVQKYKTALGSTIVQSSNAIKPSDLPVTVASDNGMILTVNSLTVTGSGVTLNITLKNNGAGTGDSMFTSSTMQAGESLMKCLSQDQVFYDGFLGFYPGMKATGNVVFGGLPATATTSIWRFHLKSGSDWDDKELTFQVR
jgi:hypothetical protein